MAPAFVPPLMLTPSRMTFFTVPSSTVLNRALPRSLRVNSPPSKVPLNGVVTGSQPSTLKFDVTL